MKVLFLDFDGVICLPSETKRDEFGFLFNPDCVHNLRKIINETGCHIVVTSSWRSSGRSELELMWEMRDMPSEIHDLTPILEDFNRGDEIEMWLSENPQVTKYCILDDVEIKNRFVSGSQVVTDKNVGITEDDVHKVIKIIGKC